MPTRRKKLLSSTRPRIPSSGNLQKLSSKTTQSIISRHHTLHKQLAQARKADDAETIKAIEADIEANGGLSLYQQASTQGQSKERGGDTSKVLVEWLGLNAKNPQSPEGGLRILEVGALSTSNALNISDVTKVRRVDLHSQSPGIEEKDFMEMLPTETWAGHRGYHIVSLSLVVNYVPDSKGRGDMLRHTVDFLTHDEVVDHDLLPCLFLVLPLSCVDNSRYLDEVRLELIMRGLNYDKLKVKRSPKLYYSLWVLSSREVEAGIVKDNFKKEEIRTGKDRNNFCIVLDSG